MDSWRSYWALRTLRALSSFESLVWSNFLGRKEAQSADYGRQSIFTLIARPISKGACWVALVR